MSKKSLLFGAIASVIAINSVFADATITTKNYVDTTRQATIPASGTNANTPGETVVTYTDTAGTIGERGIIASWENYDYANGTDDNKLVTAGAVIGQVNDIYDDIPNHLGVDMVTRVECAERQNGECILFQLEQVNAANGRACKEDGDCYWLNCYSSPHGSVSYCHPEFGYCMCGEE